MFILAMFVLATQTVRHVYVKWLEDRTSVLDRYTKDKTDLEIAKAESLQELLVKYGPAKEKTDSLDKEHKSMSDEERKKFTKDHEEEYQVERQLGSAIHDWEAKSKEIRELRVFWGCGFGLLILGALVYARGGRWTGTALIIPGFVEMIWWTSPTLSFVGAQLEFDRLLNNKICFSAITLALLIAAWLAKERFERNRNTPREDFQNQK